MLPAVPDGIVLPKAEGASSLKALDSWLPENMLILPIATETPAAIFSAGTYGGITARLAGLTLGAEDLPAALGAVTGREAEGRSTAAYELEPAPTLFGPTHRTPVL